jgi:4-hydroxy-tetrahydrodipicolinate synthase
MFKGSYTALITPFKGENANIVDYDAYEKIIEHQIESGTHGLVPCGTTGESPTLSHTEHAKVIEYCIKVASGRAKVMAGTGSNSTDEAIERTQHAQKAGADAVLVMTPYYNKPTQEGIYQHFKAIHDNSDVPIFIYNIPGRSVVDISDETIARMANDLERVVGLKDATSQLNRPQNLKKLLNDSKDFYQLSGEDGTAVEFNKNGGVGCISVTSNVAPALCAEMQEATLSGDFDKANEIDAKLQPLHDILFAETSPQPVKYAASLLNMCEPSLRLPLIKCSEKLRPKIEKIMTDIGLI